MGVVHDVMVAGSCVRSNRTLGCLEIQGGEGHNDWLEGIDDERFLEKLFEFESDGIFRFRGWRENCIVDREMRNFR